MKTVSIVLVILNHSLSVEQNDMVLGPFWLDMAVPFFMIVTGITYSMSADRKGIDKFGSWFKWKNINKKLSRILIPYSIIIILEAMSYGISSSQSLGIFMYKVVTGGWGPGSYYIPVLIQLLVVFPILFFSSKKYPKTTIVLAFSFHLVFDIVANILPIADWIYRLSVFRYLVFIVVGITLYNYPKKVLEWKRKLIILALLSAAYIWMCTYYGYMPSIFIKWNTTSLPTVFWAFGLVVLAFKYINDMKEIRIRNMIEIISNGTLHIYLVQMVYFHFDFGRLNLVINILLCLIVGILFYYIEGRKSIYIRV
ncbi:acyltransferase family protein [Clostridium sp. D2Q-14]|nr:acyltransferase family protein [Anaeromonas gelatinilytica]MBS4535503.1 acyltransferase family protein [Anaeromonas gelatinilytica]